MPDGADGDRAALEADWLMLTRTTLPSLAGQRGWPVRADHCFQRIVLDAVMGGVWYDAIAGRPAYRHMAPRRLADAVALARAIVAGEVDLAVLNDRSLAWRRRARRRSNRRRGVRAADPAMVRGERGRGGPPGPRKHFAT